MTENSVIEYLPLTVERWADFERLFGPNGACAGLSQSYRDCWCTWSRSLHTGFGCRGFWRLIFANLAMMRKKTPSERSF